MISYPIFIPSANRDPGPPPGFTGTVPKSGLHTLEYAEQIGLGSRNYTLVNLDTGGK